MTRTGSDVGGEQVEGRRAVAELLAAGQRRVRTVFVSSAVVADPAVARIVATAGDALEIVSPERIERLARSDVHQGVVAQASPLQAADLDALLDGDRPFLVALDGVTDPRNLGAIMRSAETVGATGIVLPWHRVARVTAVVAKTAAGAIEHLPIALVGGIPNTLERAARGGCWSVGLDERGDRSLFDLDLADQGIVLVLGAEGRGLARLRPRERCDVLVRIPVRGHVASLNVSAAATLAVYEVARRRALS